MAKQTINPGTAPTGAGGDTFRSGSAKLQANDNELYDFIGGAANTTTLPAALPITKGGTGATTAATARANLGLGTVATATLTASDNDVVFGRVVKVGDFGLGNSRDSTYLPTDTLNGGGFGNFLSGVGLGWRDNNHRSFINAGNGGVLGFQIVAISLRDGAGTTRIGFRQRLNTGPWSSVSEFRTEANTTVDANGFIKAASPIIQLFADGIELNDEAKQQEIVFEKLGTGDYLIKGSSGFAQEGWYIETPKDANGNVLFSVIYTTLENGDISVKTYKKKFDFETVSIVADLDNPVDITESRWIDLRLQELPQPEIEMPESIAPPEFQPTGLAEAVAKVMESYHDPEQ